MNVAFDPWIPVVTLEGKPKLASLCEVLTEGHLLADLAVRPHERVSLMRLFLCVTHAALDGPRDYDEWKALPDRLPAAARKYLGDWKDSFELFHPTKPWLQIGGLTSDPEGAEEWAPVTKLFFSFASGDNSTLFDHEGASPATRSIPMHSVVVSLVTYQCFSLGGLMGRTYWGGTLCGLPADPKKANGPIKSEDGPCSPESMLHALIRRENLFLSVLANLPTHDDVAKSFANTKIGKPVWEQAPKSPVDKAAKANCTETYLGRLVPLTRFIRINPEGSGMILGNGFSYPSYAKTGQAEVSAIVVEDSYSKKDERRLLSYRPGHALWRQLASIVVQRNAEGLGGPLGLRSLAEGDECDLIVAALARKQATILDTTEAVYRIPSRLRTADGRSVYEAEVKNAEAQEQRLGWAVEEYRRTVDGDWDKRLERAGPDKPKIQAKLRSLATTHYWTSLESRLGLLLAHVAALGNDNAVSTRDEWRAYLWRSACDAYEVACGQVTPREIRAFAEGWKKLTYVPREDKKKTKKKGAKR